MSNDNFRPWPIEWTPTNVVRFWDWFAQNPAFEDSYFALQVGDAVLDKISQVVKLSDKVVVDFGSGLGRMVDKLLTRGSKVVAVDSSPESINHLKKLYKHNSSFIDGYVSTMNRTAIDDAAADIVLLIEVVEHLPDDVLQQVLQEVRRILRPGGHLVISTPNEEDLAKSSHMCPHCGCVFHRIQHVRHWSVASLESTVMPAGFETVLCAAQLFAPLPSVLRPLYRLGYQLLKGKKLPHMLYIGVSKP